MKTKLLLFLGLVIASASLATVFNGAPVHARGEKYQWINANTIRATEYNIDAISFEHEFNFTKNGATYQTGELGGCDMRFTITPSADNRSGSLAVSDNPDALCEDAARDLDRNFTIANPERGPQPDGAEVNYATVNCTQYYEGGDNVQRCQAVKKCVVDEGKTPNECLLAWNTCITNNTKDGAIPAAAKDKCAEQVSTGKLAEAMKPPADAADKTSCAIVGIGWIICPVVTFMAQIVDGAYGGVSFLLTVQPLVVTGATEGVYQAWMVMRNIANVAFVMAFLFIIFSQVTSIGITNYGVKKMLPRIIVSAILVNLSFWICAGAIDLSNILGSSLYQLLYGVKEGLTLPNMGDDFATTGSGWGGIATSVLAGAGIIGVALYITLSALLPALVGAIFAILAVFLVLTLRQALIILLVVVAPLAFVAYLLPNTESLFKKWRDLFQLLLVMYPLIAIIFGASALASTVVMGAAPDGAYKMAVQIMGAAIGIIPLVIVPTLIKTTTGVLGRFGAIVDNPNKGPADRLRKKAQGFQDKNNEIRQTRRITGDNLLGKGSARIRGDGSSRFRRVAGGVVGAPNSMAVASMNSELKQANAKKALTDAKQDYVANRVASGDDAYAQKIAGPTGDVARIQAQAVAASKNDIAQAIKDVEISANVKPGSEGLDQMAEKLAAAIDKNDDVTARAMQNLLMNSGSSGLVKYRETMTAKEDDIDYKNGVGSALRENMLNNHASVKGTANDLVQQAVRGEKMSTVSNDDKTWQLSDEDLVHQKPASIQLALNSKAVTKEQAQRIVANDQLVKHLDQDIRTQVDALSKKP